MDIRQLELFSRRNGFLRGNARAEKVHLSPGAISVQIHSLADELKTELFVRTGKRIAPTAQAVRLG